MPTPVPQPRFVLREFFGSAKGVARTLKPGQEPAAPRSVLREFLKESQQCRSG